MDESCIYEGMRAVCAVLAEVEAGAPGRPALRLAERHLHLLAELAAAGPAIPPGSAGDGGAGQPLAIKALRAPEEACHVLQ